MKILRNTIWTAVGLFGLAAIAAAPVAADQVILDDLIVDGSACIGQDCVNGESFGFDTIRIKENNLRIKAQDTSSTSSFPTQDWQITFNDSSNGGANKFSIDAISPASGTPFTIEAGAPTHSLYVDDAGRIGLGTSTPVTCIHCKDGNTPTLRLEQDGSSGFTPQTWDLAGNEANFFIRDATSGSTLPFRIFPGAPSNALTIEGSTGDIGLGTTSPIRSIHIVSGGDPPAVRLENTDGTAADWEFQVDDSGNWIFAEVGAGVNPIVVEPGTTPPAGASAIRVESSNRVGINVTNNQASEALYVVGNIEATGTITPMSDARVKQDFAPVDYDSVLEALAALDVTTWAYKAEPTVRHMGLTAQDFRTAFSDLGKAGAGGIATTDLDGVALAAIKALHRGLAERDTEIKALTERLARLEGQLSP